MSLLLDAWKKINCAPEMPEVENAPHHDVIPRAAGQNLFAAKAAPAGRRRGLIPAALFISLVSAAGGGYYVRSETFPPSLMQRQSLALPPATEAAREAAIKSTIESAILTVAAAPLPVVPLHKDSPAASGKQVIAKSSFPVSEPAEHILQDPPADLAQPIRINHGKEDDAVSPALLAAWQAYHNGDLRAAWQQYSDILHVDAKSRDALLGLAAIAQQQSQDSIAAHYYKQVLALDPRDPIAHAGMYSLLGTGNGADSESRLKLLLAQHPEAAPLHFVLGNHYAQQLRWSEAQQAYFRACDLESGNALFAFNLAVSLDHMGQGKLAAQHYRRALQLDSAGNASFDRAQTQSRLDELSNH